MKFIISLLLALCLFACNTVHKTQSLQQTRKDSTGSLVTESTTTIKVDSQTFITVTAGEKSRTVETTRDGVIITLDTDKAPSGPISWSIDTVSGNIILATPPNTKSVEITRKKTNETTGSIDYTVVDSSRRVTDIKKADSSGQVSVVHEESKAKSSEKKSLRFPLTLSLILGGALLLIFIWWRSRKHSKPFLSYKNPDL